MKCIVLVVILTSEILGILGIIVHDGTKDQGSRRFSIQTAEPSQVSQQQVLPSDGTSSGFSSLVVHRPQKTQNHSGGGLTVTDPPKGWPLSEMHISFDSHGNDQGLKNSKELKGSVTHKDQVQRQHRQHANQIEQQFNKRVKESHFHKQQHPNLIQPQPDQRKVHQQRRAQESHRQLHQETQQQDVYQQHSRQQENLAQNQDKTEVEIHPQVIIKLPEQQTAGLLRPLYVQDQTFSQQLPLSPTTQEKPFHPSVQIADSVNNEAMLTAVQYHGAHPDVFSPMTNKPASGTLHIPDPITQTLNNKAEKLHLTHGFSEEKLPKESSKAVRIRHPHTTLGASYSVGLTTPADTFKNSNQIQNLIIKENVDNQGPVPHGKTLHRQNAPNSIEIHNESVAPKKNAPNLLTPTYSISSEVLQNNNYRFPHGGRYHVGVPSDGFLSTVNNQPQLINPLSSGTHSSSARFHQSPTEQHSSHLTFEEGRQAPIGALYYQNLLTTDLLPPPARKHANPGGKHAGHTSLGLAPPGSGHPNTVPASNKIIKFVPSGAINNAFIEANNDHYISGSRNVGHQDYLPPLKPRYTDGAVYDSGNEKGNEGSATTGNAVTSGFPVSQNHGNRHPTSSGGSSDFHDFSKSVPLYSTTQEYSQLTPPRFHANPHGQQIIDTNKHSTPHSKIAASAQGVKNIVALDSSSLSYNQKNNINQQKSQKHEENVFAGFKAGQFQGGFLRNIGYSLAGQDIRNPLTYTHPTYKGSNHGNTGQNVLQFDKSVPHNIPGYLNLNSGVVHLGHPAGPFLYPQQPFVQPPGSHVQTLYVPGVGTAQAVYTNGLLGVDGHPIGMPTLVTNTQHSAEVPVNPGHAVPTSVTPAVFNGAPLTYFREQIMNTVPQGNVDVSGSNVPHAPATVFPGIGGSYPQAVHLPYNGGTGTTFILSTAPLQDYTQQGNVQQVLPVGITQHSSTFPVRVNNVQTQNVRLPAGDTQANSFGVKLTQQQHTATSMSSSSQKHQASSV